jgi:hypothetical protein
MQFDSQLWLMIIFNLTLILTITKIGFMLFRNPPSMVRIANTYLTPCPLISASPVHLQVKKYLFIHRMLKKETDDEAPYFSS